MATFNRERIPERVVHAKGAGAHGTLTITRFDGNEGSSVNYEPNSFGGPKQNPAYKEPPLKIDGNSDRYNQPITDEDFVQPGNLYRLMPADEQDRLIENFVNSLKQVPVEIQKRQLALFKRADATWGKRVAKGLGL